MTEYSSSKPRVVVEWNPVIDGMAYVFKTDSENCIAYDGTGNVSEHLLQQFQYIILKFIPIAAKLGL